MQLAFEVPGNNRHRSPHPVPFKGRQFDRDRGCVRQVVGTLLWPPYGACAWCHLAAHDADESVVGRKAVAAGDYNVFATFHVERSAWKCGMRGTCGYHACCVTIGLRKPFFNHTIVSSNRILQDVEQLAMQACARQDELV